ncbi:MAG: UvrD-helicase domain-containing protein, partial [Candidatus Marinimicrobia bacterium]|nr:UvrD-helicase domain-containing protein [Candidatus Neomarinimicrobiota bacterium]
MSLKALNKTQKEAVEAVNGPVLIFAGAGSGKTRVLTHKLYHLVNEGLFKPEEILAVTFTNKAAKEMKERVLKLLKASDLNLSMGTFHSICARVLREDIDVLGFSRHFAIYDVKDQLDLVKILFESFEISKNLITPNQLRNQISLFKNKMMEPKAVESKAKTILEKTVSKIYKEYQKNLKLNDALDFDDLLTFPLEIFKKKPSVLKKYQKRWKYILVDEYQDTNRAQFQFLTNLASAHENICVVGDDDQSIYGWRGADVSNILDFEKTFSSCKVFKLEKNYRSTQEILNAATAVVMHNDKRESKNLVAANGSGETLGLLETIDEQEEASAVVSSIEKEIKLNKRTFNKFSVLYRTNAQSRALEESFIRQGIPYNIIGSVRFYERKEVKNVIAYLRLVVNLKDTISLRRIINFPARGIGAKTIDKCVEQAKKDKIEFIDVLKNPNNMEIRGKQADALFKFYNIIIKYHDLRKKLSASELARSLVEEIGILTHFKESKEPDAKDRFDNVAELLTSIEEFSVRNPDSELSAFLENVSLQTDIDNWNDTDNRVTLMTIHSSKGLEFPVVFIAGMDEGLFPLFRSLDDKSELEEERRLFYVALTRAEEKVYLLYATNRRRMGAETVNGLPSRFINEIPEEALDRISFSSAVTRKFVAGKRKKDGLTQMVRTVTDFDDFQVGDNVEHS